MIKINRISHLTLTTPDLERQIEYYTGILGLTLTGREKDAAYLATKQGLLAVVLNRGDVARCARLGFQASLSDGLVESSRALAQAGVKAERRSEPAPGIREALTFSDPEGTVIDVFAESDLLAEDAASSVIMPAKLGHVAFNVLDVPKVVDFYTKVLGFRFSDSRSDFFVFLRCGSDHHTLNFWSHTKTTKMHHLAFALKDGAEILRACDFLGKHNYHLIWGPGRHIIGHNIFIYHRNPDGQIVEFYADMDQMTDDDQNFFEPRPWHQDRPQRPKRWPADTLGNYWGGMVPAGFGD